MHVRCTLPAIIMGGILQTRLGPTLNITSPSSVPPVPPDLLGRRHRLHRPHHRVLLLRGRHRRLSDHPIIAPSLFSSSSLSSARAHSPLSLPPSLSLMLPLSGGAPHSHSLSQHLSRPSLVKGPQAGSVAKRRNKSSFNLENWPNPQIGNG